MPFENARFIFAEHFLEHFALDEALGLLRECRRVLSDDGVLRMSTPNLDWVWATSYPSRWTEAGPMTAVIDVRAWQHDDAAARDCVNLNRGFRAWGHKFLWNAAMLERSLQYAGFAGVDWCEYGRSRHPELVGLERHERYADSPGLPHVLIAEASGRGSWKWSAALGEVLEQYRRDSALD